MKSYSSYTQPWDSIKSLIKEVVIDNGITSIGSRSFEYYSNILNVKISNSVTSIESYAFKSCLSLKNIEIPSSVISISDYAFDYCEKLEIVSFFGIIQPSCSNTSFNKCDKLQSIKVPVDSFSR